MRHVSDEKLKGLLDHCDQTTRDLAADLTDARAALAAIIAALNYDLRDLPERVCDQRLWQTNMTAFKIATQGITC
jgi:hypothetical protein